MLDNIFNFFLSFSHETVIIPLILIGCIGKNRKIFFHAICLILFSIIVNIALKVTFQVPLPPTLNKTGFAFPSGHMQSSVVFYGWFYRFLEKLWLKLFILILLAGIGLGLVHFGYHNYKDVLGGIFFGCLLLFSYGWCQKKFKEKTVFLALIIFSIFLIIYIKI